MNESFRFKVRIYTDGACKGNPGPGGWAAILIYEQHEKTISGGKQRTTNNNMELTAVVEALKLLKRPCIVEVITDSKYVADSFEKGWYRSWIEQKQLGRPNYELWNCLYSLAEKHKIKIGWVRGHNGNHYNEICDRIAQSEAVKFR